MPLTYLYVLLHCKELTLLPDCVRKWNSLDKQKRNEGSHDTFKKNIANTVKCSSLFYIGIRKFNVIHAQLGMNCSNLNAHLLVYALTA